MTKKKFILIGGLVALCLLVVLGITMCAPGADKPVEESVATQPKATEGTTRNYAIEIKNAGGQPLEEIGIYVYTDSTMQELVWFAKTDAEGKIAFTDAASDSFVAVLSNVPAGYLVDEYYPLTGETTQIVLEAGLMEGDLSQLNYKLGDLMMDFTVTDPAGKEYVFSEVLKEKKAIVLNFWYLQCDPCKSEFPYLQEAYEQYDEDVLVLAMNPINTEDSEIAKFRKDNGYTFPMMKCDPAWEKAMNITAYPTTVVIDRFGNICMIHKGAVTEAETFETMFQFFSAEEYTQTFVKDLTELEELAGVEQTVGTKDNPVEIGMTSSFQVTVEPGQQMYYSIYRVTGTVYFSMNAADISVTYNGATYKNNASFAITSEGPSVLIPLMFENKGTTTKTFTVYLGRAAGTYDNPYKLELGDFTAKVNAGNESGVYYTYTAEDTGLFVVNVEDVTAGVNYNIVAYNLTTYALRNSQDGKDGKYVAVNANKGDRIQVTVGTLPDSSNTYPAATFQLKAEIRVGESEGTGQTKLISYSINVTDEKRNPIPNVMMSMKVGTSNVAMITNTDGYAISSQNAGTYPVVLSIPNGYSARTTEFVLTEKYPSVTVMLEKIIVEEETFTVLVRDAAGNPIEGAFVSIGTGYAQTDENGIAVITVAKGSYTAVVSADGYTVGEAEVSPENTTVEITLEEGESADKLAYTVTAEDYFGNPVSGIVLTFKQNGAVRASVTTDGSGMAVAELPAGTYDVGIPADMYTNEAYAYVTEDAPEATICVYRGVVGDVDNIYEIDRYILYLGATYVEGLQPNADNYFVFVPEVDGVYRFTGIESDAAISYWGNNTAFLTDNTANTDYNSATNSFTLNIKPTHLGSSYVLGMKDDTWGVIVIERIGDAILDVTDMEEIPYERQNNLESNFTLNLGSGEKLTYVDVFGPDVTYVKGSDGYYHLNSATGPILYVNLGDRAPYLAMSKCMGVTDEHAVYKLVYVHYDENGNPVKKETYNPCMIEYVNSRCKKTDVYPLTDDLIFMLQQGDKIKGWGDFDSYEYLFYDANHEKIPGVNESIAWMFAVCYVE